MTGVLQNLASPQYIAELMDISSLYIAQRRFATAPSVAKQQASTIHKLDILAASMTDCG